MDLDSAVTNLLSSDTNEQRAAEQALTGFLEADYQQTLVRLSDIAKNEANGNIVRASSAALAFKNAISARDPGMKQLKQEAWMQNPVNVRDVIKRNILEALQTNNSAVGRNVAQCVANIALSELVRGDWQTLIPQLTSTVMNPQTGPVVKQSYLEAIGYICEDISMQAISSYSNMILSAIVSAMRKEEPSNEIRVAGATALLNSIDFFKGNFEREEERNYIMTVVCEATQAEEMRLKVGALQCVVKIIQCYYDYMHPYMQAALFPISYQAMSSGIQEVVLQGIEFWSTVCEMEINLNFEEAEARDEERIPQHKSFKFVLQYIQLVSGNLLQLLAQQPDVDEGDDWVPSKAASVCLMLIAQCVQQEVLPHVVPFVDQNIANASWRYRDAACVAFGSVLEGPEPVRLREIVNQAYDVILALMADENVAVRDSAAWVVQRMCQLVREAVLPQERFKNTVMVLRGNLVSPPRVAANVCWALGTLAQASFELAQAPDPNGMPQTFSLSQDFGQIVKELLNTAYRADSSQSNLRTAAFGAVGEFLSHSPNDCYQIVHECGGMILIQLEGILTKEPQLSSGERHQHGDYCQQLLGLLQTTVKRLHKSELAGMAERIFAVCDGVLMLHPMGRSFQAEPEAFMCLHVLLEQLGDSFAVFLDRLKPHVSEALRTFSEHSLLNSALNLTGEICRTFEVKVLHFIQEVMESIVNLVARVNDPSGLVKPKAIQTLGDIALSLGVHFNPWAVMAFECLMAVSVPQDHDVWLDILDAILDACIGIMNGIKGDAYTQDTKGLVHHYTKFMMSLITHVANESVPLSDTTLSSAAALIGEFCILFGPEILQILDREEFYALLNKGKKSSKTKTKTFAAWALKELKKLKNAQGQVPGRK